MAAINTLIDTLRATIPTYSRFIAKTEIGNPYSIEDNNEIFLKNGWGLAIGEGSNSDLSTDYSLSTERSIGVVLSRRVLDVHNKGLQINEISKELLLDATELRDNFMDLSKFGVLLGGENILYGGDSGINFIGSDKFNFIWTELSFVFEIVEDINRN
jgi:hypothetical protein